ARRAREPRRGRERGVGDRAGRALRAVHRSGVAAHRGDGGLGLPAVRIPLLRRGVAPHAAVPHLGSDPSPGRATAPHPRRVRPAL
ncbi:hypothetical protein ABTE71_20090, partial [Acinetobacter baumannii]